MSKDAVILSVPPILLLGPHLAPAILKSYVKQHGFDVFCYDPSYDFFSNLSEQQQSNWPYNDFTKDLPDNYVEDSFKKWLDNINKHNPKILGLSTHAWASLYFLKSFCHYLKKNEHSFEIILGGPLSMEIGKEFKEKGLIDHYVVGEGEEAFLSILNNNYDHPNINGDVPKPLSNEDFSQIPYPDFSDYNFDINKKLHKNANRIYLAGSRGCAYSCSFCNVPSMTIQYRKKDPSNFAKEIHHFNDKYTPSFVELCDSITNVSFPYFNKLCSQLIELKTPSSHPLKLVCFYRVKKASQTKEETFKLASAAGIYRLKVGVESGSIQVRNHIGKNETNDDIFHTINLCHKYSIKVNLLLIAGYVNETQEDFEQTIELLEQIKLRGLDPAIEAVVINELYVSQNTPLEEILKDDATFTSRTDEKGEQDWTIEINSNEKITREVRTHRVKALKEYVKNHFYKTKNLLSFSSESKTSEQLLKK